MGKMNKTTDSKFWMGHEEKGALVHCWSEGKLVQPLGKLVGRALKRLKVNLPYDPAIPCSIFTIARKRKQPKCPSTEEWMMKMWHINPFSCEEKENHEICS